METTSPQSDQTMSAFQTRLAQLWRIVRHPGLTLALLLILGLVLLAGWLIPQQAAPGTPLSVWSASLPPAMQAWAEPLYGWGLSRLLYTPWLWAPLALLLLNSLIALADYSLPSWQRAQEETADIERQHPLARRTECAVRLSDTPDERLADLERRLQAQGFLLVEPDPEEQRTVAASRRRWAWLWPIGFYGGAILLCLAVVLTRYSRQTEVLTLWPAKQSNSELFDSQVALHGVDSGGREGTIIFDPNDEGQPALAFFLQPYRPVLFKQTLIWATAIEPVLTLEARDDSGRARRLMPIQAELGPDTLLNLPLTGGDDPLYFSIPTADLAVQILPAADQASAAYNVQARRIDENVLLDTKTVQPGQTFEIDDLSITLKKNYNLHFSAWRDFGLPFYVVSLGLMLASVVVWLGFPPWQVWLIADVKGRGGQLYGVAEAPASAETLMDFLEELLGKTAPAEETGAAAEAQTAEPPSQPPSPA